ncbi:MAG: TolC family protein [Candidatus Thiodiazotropha sp.]
MATLLLVSTATSAQNGLTDAVKAAISLDPLAQQMESRKSLASARETRASQWLAGDPAFNLKYQTDAIGSDLGYQEWEGGVELPLWWPGQRDALAREGEQTRIAAEAFAQSRELDIAGEVRERLWELALARSARQEARLAYDSARELEHDINRRIEGGELPRSDLLLAQKEVVAREDALQQADNRVQQAERRFSRFTGMAVPPPATAEPLAQPGELSDQHPKLQLAAAEVAMARARRDQVQAERFSGTSLWLGGKTTRAASGDDYDSAVGLEVTLPFGSRSQSAPAQAEAETALTQALADQDRTRRELQESIDVATLAYQGSLDALRRSQRKQSLADESLGMSRRAFELGETDLVRLLQARSDAMTAHQELEARRLEVGRATARLNQILGVIPQ